MLQFKMPLKSEKRKSLSVGVATISDGVKRGGSGGGGYMIEERSGTVNINEKNLENYEEKAVGLYL